MNKNDAAKMLKELMIEHGVYPEYTPGWHRKVRSLGTCHYGKKQIQLSEVNVEFMNEQECRNVILHEIAHALAGRRGEMGHGMVWKYYATKLGVSTSRFMDLEAMDEKKIKCSKYATVVISEGRVVYVTDSVFYRRPSKNISRAYIVGQMSETLGKLFYCKADDAVIGNEFDSAKFWNK